MPRDNSLMDMIEGLNRCSVSAYREGFTAAKLELRHRMAEIYRRDDIDGIEKAIKIMALATKWSLDETV